MSILTQFENKKIFYLYFFPVTKIEFWHFHQLDDNVKADRNIPKWIKAMKTPEISH